ncbi:MAG: DNA-3-methyladenine glycosylase [Clostridiales bacterium]|nr:DNA-3-methyladenine glycosylase [Clostridiales bacterium]
MARLDAAFYDRDTRLVAKELLGCCLVRRWGGETPVCRITETEAYIGRMDKACHAWQYRRTARTEPLFAPPGHAYIYLIYGMYHCLNLVTEPEGEPAAVLIRGAQPVAGLAQMARLRYGKLPEELTAAQSRNLMNGPGKLCKALSITRMDNLADLTGDDLYICAAPEDAGLSLPPRLVGEIHVTKRIGIDYAEEAADFPWRYYID